jgi:Protein of unknown function (DUF3499)
VRACAKIRCGAVANATVVLRYGSREVVVLDLLERHDPNLLDLCEDHVGRLTPPMGWSVTDARTVATGQRAPAGAS